MDKFCIFCLLCPIYKYGIMSLNKVIVKLVKNNFQEDAICQNV